MKKTKKKKPSPTKNKAGKEINSKNETNINLGSLFSFKKKTSKKEIHYNEKNKQYNSNIIFVVISILSTWFKNF
jgi:hypothetical protein